MSVTITTGGATPGSETLTGLIFNSSSSSAPTSSSLASTSTGSPSVSTRRGNATVSTSGASTPTSSMSHTTGVTSSRRSYLIGFSVGATVVALIILGSCLLYFRRRKRNRDAEEARKRMDTTMLRQAVGLPPVSMNAMGRVREGRRSSDNGRDGQQYTQGEHHDAASDLQPPDYDLLTPSSALSSSAPLMQSRSTTSSQYSNPFADPNPFADARSLARTTSSMSSRTTLPGYTEYEHLDGISMHVDFPPLYEDIHTRRISDR